MPVWELIAENAERGAKVLVEEYSARLYATAFRICLNEKDAEDLVFRTFARVIGGIRSFRGESSFFTWMYTIMMNFRRMDMRRKGANALVLVDELPECADIRPSPSDATSANDEAAQLRAAVSALPYDIRVAVVLHYFDDMSVPEIAKMLSVPDGTVYWQLHEGRRLIRERLSKALRRDGI